jgi:hypothetical protein
MSEDARAPGALPSDLPAEATSADDSSLPFFNHPRFQEIYKEWQKREQILDELGGIICTRSYAIRDAGTLMAMLDDACAVQDLFAGKISANAFLTQLEKFAQAPVFYGFLLDLGELLAQRVDGFKRLISQHREKVQSPRN